MSNTAIQGLSLGIMTVLLSGCVRPLHGPPAANGQTPRSESTTAAFVPSSVPTQRGEFPKPPELDPAIAFWQQVFGVWRAHQIALHDENYPGVVYAVVEITGYIGGNLSAAQQGVVNRRKRLLKAHLNDLEYRLRKRIGLTAEQTRLHQVILRGAGQSAVRGAANRVRTQRGMRESFAKSLVASGRYGALFRQVFQEAGLPEGLADLPHVESAFRPQARSSKGAVGVWQFMPTTGKRFLVMNRVIDERYDPVFAARGAARYLAYAHSKLGDWGLTVTSYNHGLAGMLRAREQHGTDIGRIVRQYEAPSFGFASRNYYAEFLAVRAILADLPHFFPEGVRFQPDLMNHRIRLARAATVGELAKQHRVTYTTLASLNPAWSTAAAEGRVALPASTEVWLPSAGTSPGEVLFEPHELNGGDGLRKAAPISTAATSPYAPARSWTLWRMLPAHLQINAAGFTFHANPDRLCDATGTGVTSDPIGARPSRFQIARPLLDDTAAVKWKPHSDATSGDAPRTGIWRNGGRISLTDPLAVEVEGISVNSRPQDNGSGSGSSSAGDMTASQWKPNPSAPDLRECVDPLRGRRLITMAKWNGEGIAMLQRFATGVFGKH